MDQKLAYTHLIALRYSPDYSAERYGLTLNTGRPSDGVKVNRTSLICECVWCEYSLILLCRLRLEEERLVHQLITVDLSMEMKYVCMPLHLQMALVMVKRAQS
jgi:hypothetical protein